MNSPTPAIVAQSAVRRLPRLALLMLCLVYVLPGFVGREPWKSADITAYGFMSEIANGFSGWLQPEMLGKAPDVDALLPYWIGAITLKLTPSFVSGDLAVRIVFGLFLVFTFVATWYAVYYLARSPRAQPVAFAFGGEARPADYARAIADGGLLALVACFGLAQLSHETTPGLIQLSMTTLMFYGVAAMPFSVRGPAVAFIVGTLGLTLSGAPTVALLVGLGASVVCLIDRAAYQDTFQDAFRASHDTEGRNYTETRIYWAVFTLLTTLACAAVASKLHLWHFRIEMPAPNLRTWESLGRLFLWFTWPAWPLVLWTLWRWRGQLFNRHMSRHLAVPILFAGVTVATTIATPASDRSLLVGLPAIATLAAFALPTLSRSVAALIDWFTLLFFTGAAVLIWLGWLAMQTGIPPKPAANLYRAYPGFEPSFSMLALIIAIGATGAWFWIVKWRVGRNQSAIWKSMVLPAGGAVLSWLLFLTLWLPLLDYARSYEPMVRRVLPFIPRSECVEVSGLNDAQIAAFRFHGQLQLKRAAANPRCDWLIVAPGGFEALPSWTRKDWALQVIARRPRSDSDAVELYRRLRK